MVLMKEFKIEDLLEKRTSLKENVALETSKIRTDEFSLRAISATNQNHGAGFFVRPDDHDLLNNMLSISANGANSGFVAYQSLPFAIAQDSYAMELRSFPFGCNSKPIYLYLAAAISKYSLVVYGYQNKAGWERFKESYVSLPVQSLSDTEPDWAYMEQYMKEIEKKTILKVKEENDREISRLKQLVGENAGEELGEVEYAEFRVGDLFEHESIPQTPRGFQPDKKKNGIPFITQTQNDNGINAYLDKTNELPIIKGKILILGVDTANKGVIYWQEKEFYGNKLVGLRSEQVNNFSIQYIITLLRKQYQTRYDYTDKISKSIILDTFITLPAHPKDNSKPYWEYMERYIHSIKMSLFLTVDKYLSESLVS